MEMSVTNFNEVREQFLLEIRSENGGDPTRASVQLGSNWNVPGSSWTMELKGSKRIEIVGTSDKQLKITAVFCGTLAGEFFPFQLIYIYQSKTTAHLPRFKFPDD